MASPGRAFTPHWETAGALIALWYPWMQGSQSGLNTTAVFSSCSAWWIRFNLFNIVDSKRKDFAPHLLKKAHGVYSNKYLGFFPCFQRKRPGQTQTPKVTGKTPEKDRKMNNYTTYMLYRYDAHIHMVLWVDGTDWWAHLSLNIEYQIIESFAKLQWIWTAARAARKRRIDAHRRSWAWLGSKAWNTGTRRNNSPICRFVNTYLLHAVIIYYIILYNYIHYIHHTILYSISIVALQR